jgi:hypothetical protein
MPKEESWKKKLKSTSPFIITMQRMIRAKKIKKMEVKQRPPLGIMARRNRPAFAVLKIKENRGNIGDFLFSYLVLGEVAVLPHAETLILGDSLLLLESR